MSDKPATNHFPKIENQKTQENYDFNHCKLNVQQMRFSHLTFENVVQCMDGHLDYGLQAHIAKLRLKSLLRHMH